MTKTKNTINRHYMEMTRLRSLVRLGHLSKAQAMKEMKAYLEMTEGKRVIK